VVLASPIVASGVFTGVGRIVEVESLPGDPDNVSRDDLVFRRGTFHLVNENGDVSFSLNPATCKFTVTIEQTGTIDGGTGAFSNASGRFTGSGARFRSGGAQSRRELQRGGGSSPGARRRRRHRVADLLTRTSSGCGGAHRRRGGQRRPPNLHRHI
jgi:hypothetical protein